MLFRAAELGWVLGKDNVQTTTMRFGKLKRQMEGGSK
jgi:hypothetical protein